MDDFNDIPFHKLYRPELNIVAILAFTSQAEQRKTVNDLNSISKMFPNLVKVPQN